MTAIECSNLSCRYGNFMAVDDISFSVELGEFFALLGPNGAGKTTTVQMLITLLLPTSGKIAVAGFDAISQPALVRSNIGVVFQEPALDERLSAVENLEIHAVLYGLSNIKDLISEALDWASLSEVSKRAVRTFSGGMKRRLELARALMHKPKVLFMDEPTLGLDPQGRRHLWEHITTLRKEGLTVFMTTHYLQEAESCDRVGVIDQGKLVALDTPAQLKSKVLGKPEGTLEEVFIQLTGRQLRDEESNARDRMKNFARRGGENTR